jgi:disulfide oxidoreductase YuzD
MIVNKQINNTLAAIAKETNRYLNTPDKQRSYLKRILSIYKNNLTEDEQLLVMKAMFEQLNYKNIVVDPDNILAIGNVKTRTIFMVFVCTVLCMVLGSYLFRTNSQLSGIIDGIVNSIKFIF